MATHDEMAQASPAHLKDHDGSSILPFTPLPGIDFSAHLSNRDDGPDVKETPAVQPSYFSASPAAKEVAETPDEQGDDSKPTSSPELTRIRTAPADVLGRPQAISRRSTFLNSLRRSRDSYSFIFDPMSTSSESSSDDEAVAGRTQTAAQGSAMSSKNEDRRRKKHEKQGLSYSRFRMGNENYQSRGKVSKRDGRLNISINETAGTDYIAKAFGRRIKNHLDIPDANRPRKQRQHAADHASVETDADVDADTESLAAAPRGPHSRPRLNVVIIVIGSRGDIQPFLRIGQILKRDHGHRVRLATHATFRDFVEEAGLEFFSVGGNPSELMAFMVKNPGLIPSLATLREGEVHRRRVAMGEMFEGMWRACTNSTVGETDPVNLKIMTEQHPFIADAVIANPPSMAPPHIVERLGIPLFMAFTFPYSPTQQFPHPLANIKPGRSNVDANYVNFMSYPLVEMMTWQGLGDIVNKFRVKTLRLEPVSSLWAPGALYRMKVPYTYMWSPSLIPKPNDWGPEIDVTGFVFLDLASDFQPPQDLRDFLDAGEPPVYIGFGSIVVDDPESFTKMIFEAVKIAGVRALVNKGWGGIGGDGADVPEGVFMLGNCPHDWLFPKVKAVVHHGGAGTTAIGLKCARPTMIVPFFGDQPFWGAEVARHEAGALECIPYKKLTVKRLAEGIKQCLTDSARQNAQKLADSINKEGDGAVNAVRSFHRSLPLAGRQNMRCSILDDRVAVWNLKGSSLRLSSLAAEILLERGTVRRHDLKLLRHYSWNDFDGPGEPITGGMGALTDSIYDIGTGVGMVPVRIAKHIKKRQEHANKKEQIQQRKEERRRRKEAALAGIDLVHRDGDRETEHQGSKDADQSSAPARPSAGREMTTSTLGSDLSADPSQPLAQAVAEDVGHGFAKSGGALLAMPNHLHVAIAQGFHNAPRLWGDATVRKPTRITGVKSGFVAAGRELTYGVYDGFTGVVKQPVGGWKDGDTIGSKVSGFGTGVAKGLGGLVLKNLSAVIAPPAYIGKGVLVFAEKKAEGESSKKFIRKSHFRQGLIDLEKLRKECNEDPEGEERAKQIQERVDEGWKVYEDIWSTAHNMYTRKGSLTGKIRLQRAKARWARSGALENVDTANKALMVQKTGGDLDKHLKTRASELENAEAARAPGMEQTASYTEEKEEKTNISSSRQELQDLHAPPDLSKTNDGELSDTTAVGTPDDAEDGRAKKVDEGEGPRVHRHTVGAGGKKEVKKSAVAKPAMPRIATA